MRKEEREKKRKKIWLRRGRGEETKRDGKKQGRIHGNPVADGWAGAVMRKPIAIQKCYGGTDGPTDTASCRVACPRLKIKNGIYKYFYYLTNTVMWAKRFLAV